MHTFCLELMLRDLMPVRTRTGAHYSCSTYGFTRTLSSLHLALALQPVWESRESQAMLTLQCQNLSRLKPPVVLWVSLGSGYFYHICAKASCFVVFPTSVYAIAIHAQQYPPSISGRRRGSCFPSSEMQKEGGLALEEELCGFHTRLCV